jgi:hypothetical protein
MLLGSAAMSMAAMVAMPAGAAEVERTLKMSGWVNKAASFVEDGDSSYTDFKEPGHGRSRVRWIGEAKGPDFTMGGVIELGLRINSPQSQTTNDSGGSDSGTLQGRRAAVYIKSKKFGTLNLGKYQAASDGHVEADLSGTVVSSKNGEYVGIKGTTYRFLPDGTDMGGVGGFDRDGDGTVEASESYPNSSININPILNQLDNLQSNGRPNGVRYTSPSFQGASLRFGAYEGGSTDVAVHYYGKIFDTKIAARFAAYNTAGADVNANTHGGWGGSISGLHSSGISLTFAGAQQDDTRRATQTNVLNNGQVLNQTNTPAAVDDPTNLWFRAGYQFKGVSFGKTHLSVNWQESEDLNGTNQEVEVWGFNIVQNFDAYGTEIYGGWANFDLDTGNNLDYEDIDAGWVGMRVKF